MKLPPLPEPFALIDQDDSETWADLTDLAFQVGPIKVGAELFSAEQVRQAQREAVAAAVPEGWKLVPIEPTIDMLSALSGEWHSSRHRPDRYAAMLAASPEVKP